MPFYLVTNNKRFPISDWDGKEIKPHQINEVKQQVIDAGGTQVMETLRQISRNAYTVHDEDGNTVYEPSSQAALPTSITLITGVEPMPTSLTDVLALRASLVEQIRKLDEETIAPLLQQYRQELQVAVGKIDELQQQLRNDTETPLLPALDQILSIDLMLDDVKLSA